MAGSSRLLFTDNFARNLDGIESFLSVEGRAVFQRLLDRLFDDICPQLARFPKSGRLFLGHEIGSTEARDLVERLKDKLRAGDELREFVVDAFIVLYLIRGNRVYFLAIKHHRQLSYDLLRFWS
jgi:plasmid stabilization system protein ParE